MGGIPAIPSTHGDQFGCGERHVAYLNWGQAASSIKVLSGWKHEPMSVIWIALGKHDPLLLLLLKHSMETMLFIGFCIALHVNSEQLLS
jgi:hypothetical protein